MNDARLRTLVMIFLATAYVAIGGNFVLSIVTTPDQRGSALPGALLCCLFVANVCLVLAQRVRALEKRLEALERGSDGGPR